MTERLIELRNICKRYGSGEAAFNALTDVNLTVDQGEFVAIMGPSGSGKSTMMNIIGALDSPTGGEYLFKGLHVEKLSRDERALLRRQFLGFVFQGFNLLARTTALENVGLPLLYRGVSTEERHKLARAALDRVGLLPWSGTRPPSSRAASSSAWRLPARSSRTRSFCSPTSPREASTVTEASRSWSF